MKFDLTNIFDLLADPLSRLQVLKDFQQEVFEKVLGDEKSVIFKGVVLEIVDLSKTPATVTAASTAGSETRYAVRARIEELHGSIPSPLEYLNQKKPNGDINNIIDMHEIIYSVNVANSDIGNTGDIYVPVVGDIVEIVEVEKNIFRFGNKIGVNHKLQGFTKVTDPSQLDTPSSYETSINEDFANNPAYQQNAASGPASAGLNDQSPVKEAALAGDFYSDPPRGLPCSGYIAIWVMNQLGMKPPQSQWKDWKSWSRLDLNLWKTINLVGGDLGDTYNIDEIQKRLGGSVSRYSESQTLPKPGNGPMLTVGRWHIVQHWCPPSSADGYPAGHIYLIYWDGGDKVLKWHSSHKRRYREETKSLSSWWGGGCKKAIVTLPIGDTTTVADDVGTPPPDRLVPSGQTTSSDQFPGSVLPIDMAVSRVTSRMGTRENPFGTGTTDAHNGIDIAAPMNTPMYALYDGVVIDARGTTIGGKEVGGFGAWVVVKHTNIKDVGGNSHTLYALYGHVNGSYVKTGDRVRQGQAITVVGNEGGSTGPHLHFEISKGWYGAPISRSDGRMDPIYVFGWDI